MGSDVGVTGEHNTMVARVCIILVLAMAKGCWWMLEQPKGSLLSGHTLFQQVLRLCNVVVSRATCNLGEFGADSKKPVWVYSSTLAKLVISFCFPLMQK